MRTPTSGTPAPEEIFELLPHLPKGLTNPNASSGGPVKATQNGRLLGGPSQRKRNVGLLRRLCARSCIPVAVAELVSPQTNAHHPRRSDTKLSLTKQNTLLFPHRPPKASIVAHRSQRLASPIDIRAHAALELASSIVRHRWRQSAACLCNGSGLPRRNKARAAVTFDHKRGMSPPNAKQAQAFL